MSDTTTRTRPRGGESNFESARGRDDERGSAAENGSVTDKLKSVGVDTEVMANTAKEQASELQRLVNDEMRAHPMRTLGIAAAVGLFVGLLTAR